MQTFSSRLHGCLLGCLLFVAASAAAAPPIRVGMELAYPPFEMTDPQGRPTGVSVKLAEALGQHLGRDVVIENIAFDGLIPTLKTGKIDCKPDAVLKGPFDEAPLLK